MTSALYLGSLSGVINCGDENKAANNYDHSYNEPLCYFYTTTKLPHQRKGIATSKERNCHIKGKELPHQRKGIGRLLTAFIK